MKARIKATGENIEVISKQITLISGHETVKYIDQKTGVSYFEEELCFPKDLTDDLDYWEKLKHQYAGMAMQGMLSNAVGFDEVRKQAYNSGIDNLIVLITDAAVDYATALVNKLKNE